MKSFIRTSAMLLAMVLVACGSPKKEEDSMTTAEKKNEEAFDNTHKEKDAEFIVDAMEASYSTIALTKLTLLNSSDSALQRKVKVIESDHTRLLGELRAYSSTHLISVPAEESKDAKEKLSSLTNSQGEEFDAKVCALLREQFQGEIRKLEVCMNRTKDAELKNWVAVALPLLN